MGESRTPILIVTSPALRLVCTSYYFHPQEWVPVILDHAHTLGSMLLSPYRIALNILNRSVRLRDTSGEYWDATKHSCIYFSYTVF